MVTAASKSITVGPELRSAFEYWVASRALCRLYLGPGSWVLGPNTDSEVID